MQPPTKRQQETPIVQVRPCTVRGEPRWRVETLSGGKRNRQFFRTETEARAALKAAQQDIAALGKAWSTLTPRERADIMGILEEMKLAGWTLAAAWKSVKSLPAAPKAPCALRTAIDETLASKRKLKRREGYLDGLKLYLDAFAKGRESMHVSQFGAAQIEAWFHGRNEAPTTRNSNLGRLSALFDFCWRRGYIAENPCDRVEKVSVDQKTPSTLTRQQCIKTLAWCIRKRPQFLGWLTLALFVGLRPEAEADNIDWSVIDLKKNRIRIEGDSTKVRRCRLIDLELCPPAAPWLKLAKAHNAPLDISHSTRRRYLRELRDMLGFKKWPQDVLRHTAATNLLALHQDAAKVSLFLGNSAATLLKNYADQMQTKEEAQKFMKLLPKQRHHPKTHSGESP